jgi:hypothetical protein
MPFIIYASGYPTRSFNVPPLRVLPLLIPVIQIPASGNGAYYLINSLSPASRKGKTIGWEPGRKNQDGFENEFLNNLGMEQRAQV